MKIFSRMLYIVLEQQWTSSTMTGGCQWSSRSRTILKRIAAGSEPIIAENALGTSTNKVIWIASILGNWEAVGLNFRIPHTKGMWGKRKNECQGMQSFLHTLITIAISWLSAECCRSMPSMLNHRKYRLFVTTVLRTNSLMQTDILQGDWAVFNVTMLWNHLCGIESFKVLLYRLPWWWFGRSWGRHLTAHITERHFR